MGLTKSEPQAGLPWRAANRWTRIVNFTVNFPSGTQSAASLIAVSKAFASKAGMLWIRPNP